MKNPLGSNVPKELARGRQCFEKWRRTHKRRTRLPEPLWALAAKLAREHGLNRTAQTLRLDYHGLKKRIQLPLFDEASAAIAPPSFLELRPAGAPLTVACTIECENGQGAKIRIHLQGRELPDLAALSRGLWNPER